MTPPPVSLSASLPETRGLAGDRPPGAAQSAARDFEAAFIAEMLSHSGFDKALTHNSGFGGETMASFLIAEISNRLAMRGEFGIAALVEKQLGERK